MAKRNTYSYETIDIPEREVREWIAKKFNITEPFDVSWPNPMYLGYDRERILSVRKTR